MTPTGVHRVDRRRPRGRRWLPAVAVLAVLAVIGGVLWLMTPPTDAAAASGALSTSSAADSPAAVSPATSPAPTTSAAPESTPATTAVPTTVTSVPTPDPAATSVPTMPASVVPVAAAAADPGVEGEVLALVNAERAAAGCGALVADAGLADVARAHSADMRDRGYFSHVSPEGLSPFDRAAAAGVAGSRAENIAQGQPDAASVMAAWMASPGHRANILDCSLTRLGVGVAQGTGGPWWTQLFGS